MFECTPAAANHCNGAIPRPPSSLACNPLSSYSPCSALQQQNVTEVVVAPPALHIEHTLANLRKDTAVCVQNVWAGAKDFGAYTGETTPAMAKDFGVPYALVGHSERRYAVAEETDELVNSKLLASLKAGLKVIVAFGETLEQRKAGITQKVVLAQLATVLATVPESVFANHVVLAYEPVWAIGTGLTASPEQAQEVHAAIRTYLADAYNADVAATSILIYGGSVKPANCEALIAKADIDGFLIGGCSLKPDFLSIIDKVSV